MALFKRTNNIITGTDGRKLFRPPFMLEYWFYAYVVEDKKTILKLKSLTAVCVFLMFTLGVFGGAIFFNILQKYVTELNGLYYVCFVFMLYYLLCQILIKPSLKKLERVELNENTVDGDAEYKKYLISILPILLIMIAVILITLFSILKP